MKKNLAVIGGCLLIALGCTKEPLNIDAVEEMPEVALVSGRCAAEQVLQEQLAADPGLAAKMQAIEVATQLFIKKPSAEVLSGDVMTIPVVVNVLYATAAQNISQAQIQSQIDVLNADFAASNTDYSLTPATFQSARSGDTKIRFVLDQVIRKATNRTSFRTDDGMKKSSKGGINPTSPATKLNLWVCNLSGGILGYAQFPGGSLSTDGVVIDDNATGKTGSAAAPYGMGRTATHEVGHWLNLRHIWGDATCGNDFVNDTPLHQTSNGGCPTFPKYGSCSSTVPMMTMNYMDYTYDACMYMFTTGQSTRMAATYAVGGPRASFR